MNWTKQVQGYYGSGNTPCNIFVCNDNYMSWYCVEGSPIVNATYDDIELGCDIETLNDIDCFTWSSPIETLEELEIAVED